MRKYLLAIATLTTAFAFVVVADAATYTRDLTIGSTGSDVVALQDMLVASGDLVLPAGVSKGYFGALTKAALAKWQAKNGVTPAAGYFGPITRAKAEGSSSSSSSSDTSALKGGDGDFKSFKVLGTPSSESVYEGSSVKVLGFEFTAKDSDLKVDRIQFTASSSVSTAKKPWKVFDTITVYNGSKEVASIDASDESNWDETTSGSYKYVAKISKINSVVKEGDKAKFYVEVTAKSSLKDSGSTQETGNWTFTLAQDDVRAINAEGVDVYNGSGGTKDFTLKVAKAGNMTITVDSADNKDQAIAVDDANSTDGVVAYVAQVKAKTGDAKLDKVTVTLSSPSSETLSDMINTVYLYVDGEQVGSESASSTVVFDNLSDTTINEGDKLPFEVKFDLNDTADGVRYQNNDTVKVDNMTVAYVDSSDNDRSASSDVAGGVLTLSTTSISVKAVSKADASRGVSGTNGTFPVSFTVTAPSSDDIYISQAGASAFTYDVVLASTNATTTATTTSVAISKTSGGSTSGSYFMITAGSSATFKAEVGLENLGGTDRALKTALKSIVYKVGSTSASNNSYTAGIDSDYESNSLTLYATKQN